VTLFSLAGIALAAVTLPGVWLALCVALLCNLWQPGMFNWWTLGICAGAGALGEIIELAASALGAKKAGGTRAGALSALGGTLIGAFAGSFFFFPIGTVAGAVLGAGIGAMVGEKVISKQGWHASSKIGAGAAAGRLVATIAKIAVAAGVGVTLSVAAWVP